MRFIYTISGSIKTDWVLKAPRVSNLLAGRNLGLGVLFIERRRGFIEPGGTGFEGAEMQNSFEIAAIEFCDTCISHGSPNLVIIITLTAM